MAEGEVALDSTEIRTLADSRVLIIEDDPQYGRIAKELLEQEGMEVETAKNSAEAFEKLLYSPFDVVLLDLVLGEESGLTILRELNTSGSTIPIIIMTAHASIETVTEAMRINAFDYIRKPFGQSEIRDVMKRAVLASSRREGEKEKTGKTLPIIGQSYTMVEVYKAIARVAQTDSTVLITGDSGTGKELVARAIHDNSIRVQKPFVAVNCGALTDTLLESELFGHVKGAFTGAQFAHRGIFESASGGTVFLDEISETSPAFQVKLLRVLQQRTVRPVGSSEEHPIDVRVIAATNRPVESLLSSSFRKDLLYRLSVINIHIPALRERTEDIPLLATHFLRRFNKRQNKSVAISSATLDWMKTLPWAGNVRELENAVERAVTMNATGEILPEDLIQFGLIQRHGDAAAGQPFENITIPPPPIREKSNEPAPLREIIRKHVTDVLKHTGGNKLKAAKILGVGRYTLYRMAERFGIDPKELGLTPRNAKKEKEDNKK